MSYPGGYPGGYPVYPQAPGNPPGAQPAYPPSQQQQPPQSYYQQYPPQGIPPLPTYGQPGPPPQMNFGFHVPYQQQQPYPSSEMYPKVPSPHGPGGYPPPPSGAPPSVPGAYGSPGGYPAPATGAPSVPGAYGSTGGYPSATGTPSAVPGAYGATGGYPSATGTPSAVPGAYGATGGYPSATGTPSAVPGAYGATKGYPSSTGSPGHYPRPASTGSYRAQPMGSGMPLSPTVTPSPSFNAVDDAKVLRKAMKGFGTDEGAIISVLTARSNAQRVQINIAFKAAYGKDLDKELKSELSGNFEKLILDMIVPLAEYHASEIHKAVSGIGTDERRIVDILCTASNAEIYAIKGAYQAMYKKSMESDLKGDTSGHFKRLLVSMCSGGRNENPQVDIGRAQADAKALLQAGAGRIGTDESTFNQVLATQSYPQLAAIFAEYHKLTGKTFETALKSELSGDLLRGMLAITKCAQSKANYFAERLREAMAGIGTDDSALRWLVITRSEIDMGEIKREYQRLYNKTLESDIKGDTSGDYQKTLLALIA